MKKYIDYHNEILALEAQVQALYADGPCTSAQMKEMGKLHVRINGVLDEIRHHTDRVIAASEKRGKD